MPQEDSTYSDRLSELQREILEFLRTFESIQENLLPGKLGENQARAVAVVRDTFRRFAANFAPLSPPAAFEKVHQPLCDAVRELSSAFDLFMSKAGADWTLNFLHSRNAFCRGLYLLYELSEQLPAISAHFLMQGVRAPVRSVGNGAAKGFIQRKRNSERSDYTLYIPEDYAPEKPLPLIVAMHGGYGQGYEYIWTWLRVARSRGYAVLSPKSLGVTWDMSAPSADSRSVLQMLKEVNGEYAIDASRVYLTGLSDGGIFTYILGLEHSRLFRGLAPIAGALHPIVDPMLRRSMGKDTPIFVVHGALDFIFPVAFTRQTCDLLKTIGYKLTYEELPDWGHAFPYSINERLVLPWFESLPAKP